jgi:hypothetical protein
MALQYNPPPGWAVPGEGWRPPLDWYPDPSWPAAPDGWVFWRESEPTLEDGRRRWVGARYVGAAAVVALIGFGAVSSIHDSSAPAEHRPVAYAAASSAPVVAVTTVPAPATSRASPSPTAKPAKRAKADRAASTVRRVRPRTGTSVPPVPKRSAPATPTPSAFPGFPGFPPGGGPQPSTSTRCTRRRGWSPTAVIPDGTDHRRRHGPSRTALIRVAQLPRVIRRISFRVNISAAISRTDLPVRWSNQ